MKNITVEEFHKQQKKNRASLERLLDFVRRGREFGIEIDESFEKKICNAIENTEKEKLKIALVGGFSEGKTSIAAAWLEKLDRSSMKINHQESSDEVKIYDLDEGLELVDTPGLFGFKEKNTEAKQIEQYKDITKKYISEAHLILYVLNPFNPIKESHKEDLMWLFRTLNLLPRTVFVLSRFDEFANIENEQDYKQKYQIKRENIVSRLKELICLTQEEERDISIVAVSANPFDEGVEYWLNHIDEFNRISRIHLLQEATKKKIAENGGKLAIVEEMQKSVISDVLHRQIPIAKKSNIENQNEVKKLEKTISDDMKELERLEKKVGEVRVQLREFVGDYFSELQLRLRGTSLSTFDDFVIKEIGDEGSNIDLKIQNEFERRTNGIYADFTKIDTNFQTQFGFFEKTFTTYGKQGIELLNKSGLINPQNIIKGRDLIREGAKLFGANLKLNFKPWGAVKLAGKASAGLAVVGLLIEGYSALRDYQKEQEFERKKVEMCEDFERQKKKILELLNDESFTKEYFPQILSYRKQLNSFSQLLEDVHLKQQAFEEWVREGEIIEGEIL